MSLSVVALKKASKTKRAKPSDLFEHVDCNLCGANNYRVIYPSQYNNETQSELIEKFRASGDETLIDQVVKCKRCGFMYITPRIRSDLIFEGYSGGTDEMFVSQAKGREMTFARQLRQIEKYAPKKGRILDIGTAGGSFLYVAKNRGWDVYGVEPNKWMAKWGKKQYGIDIKAGDVFSQKYPDNHFDVVTLWDVLEHVPDPRKTLTEVNRILKKGGILVVNYPDIDSWFAKLWGKKWMFLLSVHLFYFTPRTIRIMLKQTGYKTLKIKPHWQSLSFDYIVHRMGAYSKFIQSIARGFMKLFGLQKKQVKYWVGQTLVIARKK